MTHGYYNRVCISKEEGFTREIIKINDKRGTASTYCFFCNSDCAGQSVPAGLFNCRQCGSRTADWCQRICSGRSCRKYELDGCQRHSGRYAGIWNDYCPAFWLRGCGPGPEKFCGVDVSQFGNRDCAVSGGNAGSRPAFADVANAGRNFCGYLRIYPGTVRRTFYYLFI